LNSEVYQEQTGGMDGEAIKTTIEITQDEIGEPILQLRDSEMIMDTSETSVVISNERQNGADDISTSIQDNEQTNKKVFMIQKFAEECTELLKHRSECKLPFIKFNGAYRSHFGRNCILADYGFKKQIRLFKAIAATIEITQDKNGERILQLRGSEELQTAKISNLTFSKRVQELEMASNQVSDQKENLKTFGKQGVLEKSELLECNKTGNAEENKSVNGNSSYKRKHYLQDSEIEATLDALKRQKTEKRIQELEVAGNEVSNQKGIIESFDNEKVLEKSELLELVKCSKKENAEEKKSINERKRKQSLQENENEFEESKRKRKYRCDICEKHYSKSSNLQRHIASVHEGLKPFSCPSCEYKCDREFTRKDFGRPQLAKKKHEANCKGTQL
jgi:hypothetical protein